MEELINLEKYKQFLERTLTPEYENIKRKKVKLETELND